MKFGVSSYMFVLHYYVKFLFFLLFFMVFSSITISFFHIIVNT